MRAKKDSPIHVSTLEEGATGEITVVLDFQEARWQSGFSGVPDDEYATVSSMAGARSNTTTTANRRKDGTCMLRREQHGSLGTIWHLDEGHQCVWMTEQTFQLYVSVFLEAQHACSDQPPILLEEAIRRCAQRFYWRGVVDPRVHISSTQDSLVHSSEQK